MCSLLLLVGFLQINCYTNHYYHKIDYLKIISIVYEFISSAYEFIRSSYKVISGAYGIISSFGEINSDK